MREIPEELAARIESGAATLCHAWIVERADGARLGFTDHDRDLTIDGVVCRAASGWIAGRGGDGRGTGGREPGGRRRAGRRTDHRGRRRGGAVGRGAVALWRVDWERPDLKVRLGRGTLSRIRREGGGFTAEMEGPLAALERVVGRTYGRTCDAVLGDGRCGVERGRAGLRQAVGDLRRDVRERGQFPGLPGHSGRRLPDRLPREGGRHDGGSRR